MDLPNRTCVTNKQTKRTPIGSETQNHENLCKKEKHR